MSMQQFVEAAQRAFNAHDAEGIASLWAEPMAYEAPGVATSGRDALIRRELDLWRGSSDLRSEMKVLAESGDTGVMQVRFSGTHDGEFAGLPPTGRHFELEFVAVCRFADGKLVGERIWYDRQGIVEQLGG